MTKEVQGELGIRLAALEDENRVLEAARRGRVGEQILRGFSYTVRWTSIVVIVYLIGQTVEVFAGQDSHILLYHAWIADIKLNVPRWLFAAFGIGGVAYGVGERRLRRRKTRYMGERLQKLEKLIDAKRSSSNLPLTGESRKEDHP